MSRGWLLEPAGVAKRTSAGFFGAFLGFFLLRLWGFSAVIYFLYTLFVFGSEPKQCFLG